MPSPIIEGFEDNPIAFDAAVSIEQNTKKGIRKAFFKIGKDIHTNFNNQVLRQKKSGRIYIRKDRLGRKRRHRASAPGESPANRTGTYRKSAAWINQTTQLTWGASAPHADYLEVGTSRMKPRPGLLNAIRASERNIEVNLGGGIVQEL